MNLRVLVDNNTLFSKFYYAEPGWSAYIECDNKNILFDTGYSGVFIKNAEKMGIDLCNLDYIVFSHGHIDHSWGLKYLLELYKNNKYKKPTLIANKNVFDEKINDIGEQIGIDISEEEVQSFININLTDDCLKITDNLMYLGYINRDFDPNSNIPFGKTKIGGRLQADYILDDTALVYKNDEGIVIITGCSHSGITNIIENSKKATERENIIDIIGGFHLFKNNPEQINNVKDYLQKECIKTIHPCHCTDLISKIELSKIISIEEVGVGLELNYT